MKGLFLYYHEVDMKNLTGIDKKVLTQIKVFEKFGLECKLITLESGLKNNGYRSIINKVNYRLPFSNLNPKWEYSDIYDSVDFIYFRRPACFTTHSIRVLKMIKKRNPNIKIILEIPTYPYDKELQMSWRDYPISWKDKYNRRKLKEVVDRIALISGDEIKEIFGVPVLRLFNGVDLSDITPRQVTNNDTIDLCAVAIFAKWHGYDRLLYGLSNYYNNGGTRKVKLHLVGKGIEINNYKKIVKEQNLDNYVIFHGMKTGKELDLIYDNMDIGLDVFGMYRKNLSIAYSLKSREYLAKGLPVISGCTVDLFRTDKKFKYYYEFENNGNPIDIDKIVEFYDSIYLCNETHDDIINDIRQFADQNCDISVSMRNITNYLLNK